MGRQDDGQVGAVVGDPLALVLGLLPDAKRRGNEWKARCPAHEDEHASLSVHQGENGRVLMHSHARCVVKTICGALGIKERDLFPVGSVRGGKRRKEITAVYRYADECAEVLYEAVRYKANDPTKPKDFKRRRQHPDGRGWIWGLSADWYRRGGEDWYRVNARKGDAIPPGAEHFGACRLVLYRLPALLDADPDEWVFVVEGEKDADRLAGLDLIATTNVGGACKWLDDYSETLRGRKVAVIPDNDKAGRGHADQVAGSLAGVAADVRIVDLIVHMPDLLEGGDVSDWIDHGGTVEELMRLVNHAPACVAAASAFKQDHQVSHSLDVTPFQRESGVLEPLEGEALPDFIGRLCARLKELAADARLFHFTRAVKGHPAMRGVSRKAALAQVQAILDKRPPPDGADAWQDALGVGSEQARREFQDAWDEAYALPGEPLLAPVIAEARANPIPFPTDYEGQEFGTFLTAVARLQVMRGRSPVMVSTADFGEALGLSPRTIATYRDWAVRERYMAKVKEAQFRSSGGGKCAEYLFDLTRLPGARPPAADGPQAA